MDVTDSNTLKEGLFADADHVREKSGLETRVVLSVGERRRAIWLTLCSSCPSGWSALRGRAEHSLFFLACTHKMLTHTNYIHTSR